MSTIEKAAARLVEKAKAAPKSSVTGVVDSAAEIEDTAVDVVEVAVQDSVIADAGNSQVSSSPISQDTEKACELNFPWLAENGFLVPGHTSMVQAQEFRRIKRSLLLNLRPRIAEKLPIPPNLIFVTSSVPAEGKTFVSMNLALSLSAELDKHVLLVDGDPAKGDLSRWMGIHAETGLVDLLSGDRSNGESAVIDTNLERLRVMPCGVARENLDELYASSLMSALVHGLARHDPDRIIVVDGPPLLATTEAAVLARLMGQVVMVVEADKTPLSAIEEAVILLEECQKVSLLLNKTSHAQKSTYGYGYGYGNTASGARSAPEETGN